MRVPRAAVLAVAGAAVVTAGLSAAPSALALSNAHSSFLGRFRHLTTLASTVPSNGDVNPYGVAVVGSSQGRLHRGDVLVSNFNDKANLQGTGSTIVEISPAGHVTRFAGISRSGLPGACPGGIGLTTALAVVHGWVIVGSLPSASGMAATAKAGCLLVLDSQGRVRETIAGHGINGPWDMAAVSYGRTASLFVTNVLNGTVAGKGAIVHRGTVLRLTIGFRGHQPPSLRGVTTVGSGFAEQTNAAAFVLGPTGVGVGPYGTLYIADTATNAIRAIPAALARHSSAGTGALVTSGGALSAPLGLAIAPGGDVLTVNGGNGKIVETTPAGVQVATRYLDRSGSPQGDGALFGLAVAPRGRGIYYVDDAVNTLRLLS
jgi:sugar lactone lactonase YvrE